MISIWNSPKKNAALLSNTSIYYFGDTTYIIIIATKIEEAFQFMRLSL